MESKICIKCNEIKSLKEFPIYKNKFGEHLRNVCRACYNEQDKKRRSRRSFTSKDIDVLKTIISNHQDFIIKINQDKNSRMPKTFNVNVSILEKLTEHSKKTGLSISDIVNALLQEGIKYLK